MDSCLLITKEEFLHSREYLSNSSKDLQKNTRKIIISGAIVGISLYNNISCISIEEKSIQAKKKVEKTNDKKKLVSDPNVLVRFFLAIHPDTPVETLTKLSRDKEPLVIKGLIENPNLPIELSIEMYKNNNSARSNIQSRADFYKILSILAEDSSGDVRKEIAAYYNITPEVAKKLSEDPSEDVRKQLATNNNITPEVVKKLSEDYSEVVRKQLITNRNITPEIAKIFSEDSSEGVRKELAASRNITLELAEKLRKDSSQGVRVALLSNPSTPLVIIEKMAKEDESNEVKSIALKIINANFQKEPKTNAGCTSSCTSFCTYHCTSTCTSSCIYSCNSGCTSGCTSYCTSSCTSYCTSSRTF